MSALRRLFVLASLAATSSAFAVDIPPTVILGGGSDSNNYTLTANGQVQGNGTFTGTFDTQTHDLSVNTLTGNMIFNGVISGSASSPLPNLTVLAGNHTVELNAANTFTGDVLLESGTIKLGNATALGSGSGEFRTTLATATLDLNGQTIASENAGIQASTTFTNTSATAASWGGNISISASNLTFNTSAGEIAVSGAISGGGVIKSGSGVLALSGNNSGLTGAWDLTAGTLKFGNSHAAGVGVLVNGNSTTVDLNGQAMAPANIQVGAQGVTISNTSGTAASWGGNITTNAGPLLTLNASGANLTINGAITQSGGTTSLFIDGTHTTILASASNSFTGNVTIDDGAFLELAEGSRMDFLIGGDGVNNHIGGAGEAAINGQFIFDLSGASTTIGDEWAIVDAAAYSFGGNFSILGFTKDGLNWQRNNFGTLYNFSETTGVLAVVPEPSTILLSAAGGLGLLLLRRRRA